MCRIVWRFCSRGLTIRVLLFVNLVAAHAVRFKLSAKRVGIIVTHLGVILLLAGEFVTGAFADEGNMSIDEGKSSNFVEDIRTAELAVIDKTDPTSDIVIAIPMAQLHEGRRFGIRCWGLRSTWIHGWRTRRLRRSRADGWGSAAEHGADGGHGDRAERAGTGRGTGDWGGWIDGGCSQCVCDADGWGSEAGDDDGVGAP